MISCFGHSLAIPRLSLKRGYMNSLLFRYFKRLCLTYKIEENMAKKYWFALLAYDSLGKSEGSDSCDRPNNLTQIGFNRQFVSPCDLEIWWMTFKNYRAPLVYYNKFCALFQSHRWIKTGVTVWKRSIVDFLSRVTLKCDGWPWKKMGTSSMLHEALCIISKPSVNSNWS